MFAKKSVSQIYNILKYPILLFVINFFAGWFYELFPSIDILFHFLGGYVIVISLKHFFIYNGDIDQINKLESKWRLLFVIGMVATIGVFWEVYELFLDAIINTNTQPGVADTVTDLVLDIVGAGFGYYFYWQKKIIN